MVEQAGEVTVSVRIRGRVQGVWFRAWTVEQATARGLRGWVRNCQDGSVEALFAGPADRVGEMVGLCWKGPPAARVEAVDRVTAEPFTGAGFTTLTTE